MDISHILDEAVERNHLSPEGKHYLISKKESYQQLIEDYYEVHESLEDVMDILKVISGSREKSELIDIVREDIKDKWTNEDILYYCVENLDFDYMRMLRSAFLAKVNYTRRSWLLSKEPRTFKGRDLLRVSLHALEQGFPFEMIYCFWEYKDFDLNSNENSKIFESFMRKNLNEAGALYLTYYSLVYSEREVDFLYNLTQKGLRADDIQKIMLNRRNRESKDFVDSQI